MRTIKAEYSTVVVELTNVQVFERSALCVVVIFACVCETSQNGFYGSQSPAYLKLLVNLSMEI